MNRMGMILNKIGTQIHRYLYQTEVFTKQDPYVKVWTTSTADNQQITQTSEDTGKEAFWNEKFSIYVQDSSNEHLYVEVMDKNYLLNDRLIGKAKFACSDLNATQVEAWIRIYREDGADAGEVLIGASLE